VAGVREQAFEHHLERFAATRVQRQVEARHLGHAADADPVVEAGDRHLVGLVHHGRHRCGRRVGDRHRERVTLERVDRQRQPGRACQLARVAAQREHVVVGAAQTAVDQHAIEAIAVGAQALHRAAELEGHADLATALGQPRGEQLAIAGLVAGQAQCADELVGHPCERGLGVRKRRAPEQLERHARLAQHGDVLCRRLELLLGAEHLQRAELAAFVADACFVAQRAQAVAAVFGQAQHPRLVHRIARRAAVREHLHHPLELEQRAVGPDRQRCMPLEQPFQRLQRNARRRPRRRIAGRNLARVGEAGFPCRLGLAIDDRHLHAGPCQVPGGRHADHAAAENQDTHDARSAKRARRRERRECRHSGAEAGGNFAVIQ